ncbi:uncharacterized protein [Aquarana catesbeiana]|uniref:uncharacterized protein n=1 Tax=Aquarana catesbeiana TaxID=8400 RepID=UPI003CC95686
MSKVTWPLLVPLVTSSIRAVTMAGVGAEGSMLEAELSCPVCLSTYRDPVSLGCGHCFCRQCISEALSHQKDQGRPYTCPMCQEHYQDFPALKKNLQLSSIVESFVSMQKNTEHAQIPCGDCLDQPSPAVKTCVSCEVSLCHKHLERHANRGHVLLEPTASVQDRKCAEHDKLLEYYCEQDAQCICVTCYIAGAHKGHNIMTLKQAHEKKLATLSSTTSALSNIVSTFCKDIEDLNAGLVKITENTIKLSKPLEDLCEKIILQVRGQFKKITQAILINQEETTSKMTATIKQIEDAKATTEKALDEINLISKQPDDLLFVKDFSRSQSLIKQQSPRVNMMQVVDVEADKVMIENIDKETTDYIVIIGRHLAYTHDVLSQQIEQLVWSGSQRKKVENQKAAPRVKLQKSEKMSLSFKFNCTQCSHTVKALQTRWHSAKDCFNSHLKEERSMRSGLAAMSFTPYSYAKDLEFFRLILEMRSTDTCWDNEPAEEDSSAQTQEPTNPGSPNQEMAEIAGEEEQEQGGLLHQCAQLRGGVPPNGQMRKSQRKCTLY